VTTVCRTRFNGSHLGAERWVGNNRAPAQAAAEGGNRERSLADS